MSRIRATQLLKVEDFPEQKDWIAPMFLHINRFIRDAALVINGNIRIGENIPGIEHTFEFKYQSDAVSLPLEFSWDLNERPSALHLVKAEENGAPLIALLDWKLTPEGRIRLEHIFRIDTTGPSVAALQSGFDYLIRVHVTP